MNSNVTAKFFASTLSILMVLFSIGMPFAQANFEFAEVTIPTVEVPEVSVPTVGVPEVEVPEIEVPEVEVPEVKVSSVSTHDSFSGFCKVSLSNEVINTGDSVTVYWETEGFDSVTINGEAVPAGKNSKTFKNVTQNTLFTLVAVSGDKKHNCTATADVTCIPPVITPKQCTDFGYDFNVAKAEWTGGGYTFEYIKGGYSVTINGNVASANWTGTPGVAGVIGKAATNQHMYAGGTSGTIAKYDIGTGKHDISHVLFCGNETPETTPEIECYIEADKTTIEHGESVEITWTSKNAVSSVIDQAIGIVPKNGSITVTPTADTTYTFKAANADTHVSCPITIKVNKPVDTECKLIVEKSVNKETAIPGDLIEYTIDIKNIGTANCTGGGVKIYDIHDSNLEYISETHTSNLSAGYDGSLPVYSADTRTIRWNGHTLTPGESGSITWTAKIKTPAQCGNYEVLNKAKATAFELNNFETWIYSNQVSTTVKNECDVPAPKCDSFTVTPDAFTNGTGGQVTLTWNTTNTNSVSIDNGIGAVAEDGSMTATVSGDTIFTLTAVGTGNNAQCTAVVKVEEPEEPTLSCDSFSASPTSLPRGGGDTTLTWETTDATEVSINNGVGIVAADGNTVVRVTSDTLFTLTLKDDEGNTRSCDANVTVATGGGGGGSSSPRCELQISDKKVKAGEAVTISWDNTRTNEMVLEDNRGNVLIDTEKTTKYDEDEGSITVRPTRDTEYTMTVSRGSRDRVCRVDVEVEDVTVIETRTQTPQVAGIALTSVPYTGFEAGPFLTFVFYALLALWAAFVAYVLVVRERTVLGVSLSGSTTGTPRTDEWESIVDQMHDNLETEVVVASQAAPVAEKATPASEETFISPLANVPSNLPVGEQPVFGYGALSDTVTPLSDEVVDPMTELENAAHQEQALLSSDAINFFMDRYIEEEKRFEALSATIEKAKSEFPTEGGWMVLNLERVQTLNESVATETNETVHFTPETRVGASSLAEAIVSGNVSAAFEMIGGRPMFALADAAADLDAVYRTRKGMDASASDLLESATRTLTDGQIEAMITALTSALDGAYAEEEAAVKMAIMKAVKVVG